MKFRRPAKEHFRKISWKHERRKGVEIALLWWGLRELHMGLRNRLECSNGQHLLCSKAGIAGTVRHFTGLCLQHGDSMELDPQPMPQGNSVRAGKVRTIFYVKRLPKIYLYFKIQHFCVSFLVVEITLIMLISQDITVAIFSFSIRGL